MQIIKKINVCEGVKIRDLTQPMPPDDFCAICGKKESEENNCICTKYNCFCGIKAEKCKWPSCICTNCLELNCICESKNG